MFGTSKIGSVVVRRRLAHTCHMKFPVTIKQQWGLEVTAGSPPPPTFFVKMFKVGQSIHMSEESTVVL